MSIFYSKSKSVFRSKICPSLCLSTTMSMSKSMSMSMSMSLSMSMFMFMSMSSINAGQFTRICNGGSGGILYAHLIFFFCFSFDLFCLFLSFFLI